jgi:hypothetical protein
MKCPELDSNQHALSAPPPQDGVSTNFTTWAYFVLNECKGNKFILFSIQPREFYQKRMLILNSIQYAEVF